MIHLKRSAAAAKSLQSCPTLCDPTDGSPPGSPVPGILQARTLEWVAIAFSNAWKWKLKVKSFSRVRLLATPWTAAYQAPPSMGFSRQEYWSGVPLPSTIRLLSVLLIKKKLVIGQCEEKLYKCTSSIYNPDTSGIRIYLKIYRRMFINVFRVNWASLVAQVGKNPRARQETQVRSLDWDGPLEDGTVTHSSTLAWRIPWTGAWWAAVQGVAKSRTRLSDQHFHFHFQVHC